MSPEAEIALARSAAPDSVSAHATVKVLRPSGYKVAVQGDNVFVCIVMRGWGPDVYTCTAPDLVYYAKLRASICFNPVASQTVLVLQELRARLGIEGKTPDQIAGGVQAAYARGAENGDGGIWVHLSCGPGPGVGAWHPHMIVYIPYYENAMLGGNQLGGALPIVGDDSGTPFGVTVIPVEHNLAVKAQGK